MELGGEALSLTVIAGANRGLAAGTCDFVTLRVNPFIKSDGRLGSALVQGYTKLSSSGFVLASRTTMRLLWALPSWFVARRRGTLEGVVVFDPAVSASGSAFCAP